MPPLVLELTVNTSISSYPPPGGASVSDDDAFYQHIKSILYMPFLTKRHGSAPSFTTESGRKDTQNVWEV